MELFVGFIVIAFVNLMVRIANKTEIHRLDKKYLFKCKGYGLGNIDIIQDLGESITIKYSRCGKVSSTY